MKAITDYIKQQDNLFTLSAWITLTIMLFLFILMQILSFAGLVNVSDNSREKMEIRELIKLRFTPQLREEKHKTFSLQKKEVTNATPVAKNHEEKKETKASVDIASIVQDFDIKKVTYRQSKVAKRGSSSGSNPDIAGISTKINRDAKNLDKFDLSGVLESRNSSFSASRRSSIGGSNGSKVGIGNTSHVGTGIGSKNLDLAGREMNRAIRGTGNRNSRATIDLSSGSGENSEVIDLHALIKWMKAHPGPIPKLVAYEMGHQAGDLSSSVSFTLNGRKFYLLLSCNEFELLLRICLIKGNDFTLLKDNGIREESNFLTIGDVVRDNKGIQSLISSREAPGNKAAIFYQIFWFWWQQQPESNG